MSDAELLGNELRDARLRLNLTLLQVEKQTKIRVKYLEALEQGNYSMLPSGVHARGFLRAYARFLSLDGELAVARFDEIMQGGGRRRGRKTPPPALLDETPRLKKRQSQTEGIAPAQLGAAPLAPPADSSNLLRRAIALIAVLVVLVGIGVAGYIVFGGSIRDLLSLNGDPPNTPSGILSPMPDISMTPIDLTPSVTPPPAATPTQLPIPDGGQLPTETATIPPPPPGVEGGVLVELRITARTWLQITRDGQPTFTGVLGPGQTLREQGQEIKVRVSNAIAVTVFINGVGYGPMGNRGQIAERIYRPGGESIPTPLPITPAAPADFAPPTPTSNDPSAHVPRSLS